MTYIPSMDSYLEPPLSDGLCTWCETPYDECECMERDPDAERDEQYARLEGC